MKSIGVAGIFLVFVCAVSRAQNEPKESSAAEKWVVTQLAQGQIADLESQFPNEQDRHLSARFLGDLLTNTSVNKSNRNGVRIGGAIVDETIDLSSAQLPSDVWLTHCEFKKVVTFARSSFGGVAMFDRSTFKAEANFDSVKVGHIAFFRNVVFEGLANFNSSNINWQFDATGAQFKNTKAGALFNGMKVGQVAFFQNAIFNGPADFRLADIANNFEANGAQFTNKDETVWFAMRCGRKGFFWGARFAGPVSFVDSSFSDLFIGDQTSANGSISRLDLSRCTVKRQLAIQNTKIQDLVAPSLHVEGPASFVDLTVTNSADLSFGDFLTIDLSRSVWPPDPSHFHIQSMNYKYARGAPDERPSHANLLKLAGQSAFTADVYHNLEELFSRQGYRADADAAFIAGKRREREEYFSGGHWFRWLGSWTIDLLVGYGRRPWKAGILCALLVAFGYIVFSRDKMELQQSPDEKKHAARTYNRFWYSLGLFLPFVNLQADSIWKPMKKHTFLRNYMRVHILLGWTLIPIVLAALSGLIK